MGPKRLQYDFCETHAGADHQEIAADLVAFCKYATDILVVVFPTTE